MPVRIPALLALSLLSLTAACGGAGPAAEPTPQPAAVSSLDPSGMYDFTATMGGQARTGTLLIERTADGWAGEARLTGEDEPAILHDLTVEDDVVVIDLNVSGQPVTFEVKFTGDTFAGLIFADTEAIDVTGRRRTP